MSSSGSRAGAWRARGARAASRRTRRRPRRTATNSSGFSRTRSISGRPSMLTSSSNRHRLVLERLDVVLDVALAGRSARWRTWSAVRCELVEVGVGDERAGERVRCRIRALWSAKGVRAWAWVFRRRRCGRTSPGRHWIVAGRGPGCRGPACGPRPRAPGPGRTLRSPSQTEHAGRGDQQDEHRPGSPGPYPPRSDPIPRAAVTSRKMTAVKHEDGGRHEEPGGVGVVLEPLDRADDALDLALDEVDAQLGPLAQVGRQRGHVARDPVQLGLVRREHPRLRRDLRRTRRAIGDGCSMLAGSVLPHAGPERAAARRARGVRPAAGRTSGGGTSGGGSASGGAAGRDGRAIERGRSTERERAYTSPPPQVAARPMTISPTPHPQPRQPQVRGRRRPRRRGAGCSRSTRRARPTTTRSRPTCSPSEASRP